MVFRIIGDFSLFQILAGAVLLFASVILTFQIKKNIPAELRVEWRKTSNFILFFFTAYLFFILILMRQISYDIEPVTASLFLLSACFVYLIMMLIKTFTVKIQEKDVEIKEYITKLNNKKETLEHEIAERVRTEERLQMYGKALDTMQVGVTITGTDGVITYANPADALMHGYDPDELVGKDAGALTNDNSPVRHHLDSDDTNTRKYEAVDVRRDGKLFPVQVMSSTVLNADGEPIGVVTVREDITERKMAEKDLLAYKEQVDELVNMQSAELPRAIHDLKSRINKTNGNGR